MHVLRADSEYLSQSAHAAEFHLHAVGKKLLSRIVKVQSDRGISEQELLTLVDEAQQEGGLDPQGERADPQRYRVQRPGSGRHPHPPGWMETAVALDDSLEEIAAAFANPATPPARFRRISTRSWASCTRRTSTPRPSSRASSLSEVLQSALFVPAGMHISQLLKLLQQKKTHLAIVTDEYGGNMGVVTMEDVLEELVGDIFDEHDEVSIEVEQLSPTATALRQRGPGRCLPGAGHPGGGVRQQHPQRLAGGKLERIPRSARSIGRAACALSWIRRTPVGC